MKLIPLSSRLREDERAARRVLIRGCGEDLRAIKLLISRPLREARTAVDEELASLGLLDPLLRHGILKEASAEIALRCARSAFANASVRLRARLGIYALALAQSERRFFEAAAAAAAVDESSLPFRTPPRIALPHIELDDDASIVPGGDISNDEWIVELETRLRVALEVEVERAKLTLMKRGFASLARAHTALRLASYGRGLDLY